MKPDFGCLAFLAAPVAAAALAAAIAIVTSFDPARTGSVELVGSAAFMFVAAFVVAAVHTVVLALPLYHWLERHSRPTLAIILVAGMLIGALLLSLPTGDGDDSMMLIAAFGLFGLCGALAFWAVLRLDRR